MSRPIYLDYNATTPIAPEVVAAMRPYFKEHFGNPSSSYAYGAAAHEAVNQARAEVADLVGCQPAEIVFTGSGSEANNLAIKGTAIARRGSGDHIITSAVEHPAVLSTCRYLVERFGYRLTVVPVDQYGLVDPDAIARAIEPGTILITIMHANNEVGTIQPIGAIADVACKHGITFHTDAAQSVGKIAARVDELGVDLLTIVGHKLYAPKGIGALYVRAGTKFDSLIHGAGHEDGRHAGTENVPYMVALGTACSLASARLSAGGAARAEALRDRLHHHLNQAVRGLTLNGHQVQRLPNTVNVSFPGVDGEELLSRTPAVAASTGSACHAGRTDPSGVLTAMGIDRERALGAIRLSLGYPSTEDEIDRAASALAGERARRGRLTPSDRCRHSPSASLSGRRPLPGIITQRRDLARARTDPRISVRSRLMPVLAVVGGQWGDEGKGKIIDLLAGRAHVVVRAQGGDNAGHTVVNPRGKFALHLVPAGIFNDQTRCLIGPGVALNPETLLSEMDELARRGVSTDNLIISARAHLVMPYHPLFDRLEEESRGAGAIGTTGRGIGPTYADKVGRVGIVAGDLLHLDRFETKVRASVERKNRVLDRLFGAPPVDADEIIARYQAHADRLGRYIAESEPILEQALKDGRTILLEGGHGTLLDIDHGTYPYVTTTSCTVGGLLNGAGIGPRHLTTAIGVFKAYQSRVGAGAMPSELLDDTGDHIREKGHEYGTTTGRPRRVGWFDAVAARHSMIVNGFHSIALTRIDILDDLDELQVCVAYEIDGERVDHVPSQIEDLARCTPVYEGMPGWHSPTGDAQNWKDLPRQAQEYVRLIEESVGVPAGLIGVGQEREKTIFTGALP